LDELSYPDCWRIRFDFDVLVIVVRDSFDVIDFGIADRLGIGLRREQLLLEVTQERVVVVHVAHVVVGGSFENLNKRKRIRLTITKKIDFKKKKESGVKEGVREDFIEMGQL
jgi:hypothetical protein